MNVLNIKHFRFDFKLMNPVNPVLVEMGCAVTCSRPAQRLCHDDLVIQLCFMWAGDLRLTAKKSHCDFRNALFY